MPAPGDAPLHQVNFTTGVEHVRSERSEQAREFAVGAGGLSPPRRRGVVRHIRRRPSGFGGSLNDAKIDDLTATIVPAHPAEALHLLIGWPDDIEHRQYRVKAWALEPGMPPRPITPVGPFPEYDAETTTLVRHPDGRFEELSVGDTCASLDAAKDELRRRLAEWEERKRCRASLVDAGPEVAA